PSPLRATPCASRSSASIRSHSSALVIGRLSRRVGAAKLGPPGESFVRARPPKAQTAAMARSNAQATGTGKRLLAGVLAGERLAVSGSTEGASNAVRGAANLSGRADSR